MATETLADLVDATTVLSLLATAAIVVAAYYSSQALLPSTASGKTRFLFAWHAGDGLCHLFIEGGYLYNVFFSYTTIPLLGAKLPGTVAGASSFLSPGVHFLGYTNRLYGSLYGTNPLAATWREYAKADARWGGSDLTVVSLEILTVLLGTPLCFWICNCIRTQRTDTWFWIVALAAGELYGGFMTFAPEWLSGSPNLNTGNFLHLWVYLVFFNTLWVWIPLWVMYEARNSVASGNMRVPLGTATAGKKRA